MKGDDQIHPLFPNFLVGSLGACSLQVRFTPITTPICQYLFGSCWFLVIFLSHAKIFKRMAAMPCSAFTSQRLCTGNPSKVVNCNSPLLTSPTVQIIAAEITRIFQAAVVYNSVLLRMDTACQSSLNGFCDRMISLATSPAKFPILLTKTPCKWLPTFDASLIPGRRSRVIQEAQPHKWLPSFYTPHILLGLWSAICSSITPACRLKYPILK